MILLKYRFERNLLIYFSLAYPIARGFIRAKKKEKLIGILIAGHNAILPPTNQWIPPGKYISPFSFPNFRIPSSKWGKFPWNRSTNIASVFKHRAGKNGFGFRNQGNARSNVSWSTWFEVSYGNWYFFPRLFQLDCISLSLSLSVDGRVVRPRMEKKGKKIRHVFWWILIGNMKPMLREGNELQRGSVKGITGVQPVNGNEIPDAVAWTWREEWEKWNFAFASLFPDHRLFLSFLSLLFFSSFHF